MAVGPHVFGDDRFGLWFMQPTHLADRLPKIKAAIPFMTDIFLPPGATKTDKATTLNAGFFASQWTAAHDVTATQYGNQSVTHLNNSGAGSLELNIEKPDTIINQYIRDAVKAVRAKKPLLRLRVNVAPFKGQFMPMDLFQQDPNLYLVVQAYGGNMDEIFQSFEVHNNLVAWGAPADKVSVMYAAHCAPGVGKPRIPALFSLGRFRGSIYNDDLLTDAGII